METQKFDIIAEKCLEIYNNGEFAYDDGPKTQKQRKLKSQIKADLTHMFSESSINTTESGKALLALFTKPDVSVTSQLRQKNSQLKRELKEANELNEKAEYYYKNLYKQEIKDAYRLEQDEEMVENMKITSRKNKRLENLYDEACNENIILRESHNIEEYEALKLHCDLLEEKLKKKSKKSDPKSESKEIKKLKKENKKLKKQIVELKSSDTSSDSDTDSD